MQHPLRNVSCNTTTVTQCQLQYNIFYTVSVAMKHPLQSVSCDTTADTQCQLQYNISYTVLVAIQHQLRSVSWNATTVTQCQLQYNIRVTVSVVMQHPFTQYQLQCIRYKVSVAIQDLFHSDIAMQHPLHSVSCNATSVTQCQLQYNIRYTVSVSRFFLIVSSRFMRQRCHSFSIVYFHCVG